MITKQVICEDVDFVLEPSRESWISSTKEEQRKGIVNVHIRYTDFLKTFDECPECGNHKGEKKSFFRRFSTSNGQCEWRTLVVYRECPCGINFPIFEKCIY